MKADEARKARLLVLTSTYPRWTGDYEPGFVHELSRRLTSYFDVTVLCPHAEGAATHEILDGVEVVRYRYAPAHLELLVNDGGIATNLRRRPWLWFLVPVFLVAQTWMAWRLVHQLKPTAIHAHWLIPQGVVAAALSLLPGRMPPFVVTSHGADVFALRGRLPSYLKRFALRRSSMSTAVSEGVKGELLRLGARDDSLRTEPMGIDLQGRFTPDFTIERSRTELLFVGRLVEKKGLRHLLDAMPRIIQARPETTLTVVGYGPEESARRAQVDRLGIGDNIRFAGAVIQAELPAYYRRASLFVAPFIEAESGDQEGLGLVLIEALGCGCPVVVSSLPATDGLIAGMPDAIAAVPAADPMALSAVILAELERPRKVATSPQLLEFDWENRARRYGAILSGVAK